MFKKLLYPIFFAILLISSQTQADTCMATSNGMWANSMIWSFCNGGFPTNGDDVNINLGATVDVDQTVTINTITINGGTLNANSYTITLSGAIPITNNSGTFNANTSTVKLSDADHTLDTALTFYNLNWAALTAPRTITINSAITIATGGSFGLDGTAAFPVIFTGSGNVSPAVTLSHCTNTTVTGITCPSTSSPVSASIGLSISKQAEIFATEITAK